MASINFENVDYENLPRIQKLAVFLIIIGAEQSAHVLRSFDDQEVEKICKQISEINIIDDEIQKLVLKEFSRIIADNFGTALGGSPFAHKALELSRGDVKAASIINRITPVGDITDVILEISAMGTRQIFNLTRDEQPQTIAFVLSYLNTEKAAEIIQLLPEEKRLHVIESLGVMDATPTDMVVKIAASLRTKIRKEDEKNTQQTGGVRPVADLLNLLDKEVSKEILSKLEESDPELGSAVRKKMFGFEDLIKLSTSDMQRIAREVEMNDLVLAMKSANAALKDAIYGSVSKRAAETLKEELEMLGPVKIKEVEGAQERIIQVVRRLEEEGEITIDQGGDDVIA